MDQDRNAGRVSKQIDGSKVSSLTYDMVVFVVIFRQEQVLPLSVRLYDVDVGIRVCVRVCASESSSAPPLLLLLLMMVMMCCCCGVGGDIVVDIVTSIFHSVRSLQQQRAGSRPSPAEKTTLFRPVSSGLFNP